MNHRILLYTHEWQILHSEVRNDFYLQENSMKKFREWDCKLE